MKILRVVAIPALFIMATVCRSSRDYVAEADRLFSAKKYPETALISPELTIAAAYDDARDAVRVQSRGYWDMSKPFSKRFRGSREKTLRLYLS